MKRYVTVAIGLGANVGDARAALLGAVARLGRVITGMRVSPLYRTAPVGGPRQPDYLNAVAMGRTTLAPLELLAFLKRLERDAGRGSARRLNAPRPLDLDLLLYGRERIASRRLTVPHPRLHERRFVLVPLADLVPGRVVPGLGRRVRSLLAEAPPARVTRETRPKTPRGPAR